MNALPTDWFALLAIVFVLGLKHGMDPDHLATIDGIARCNSAARPGLSRWSGVLFSLGHGLVAIAITALAGIAAGRWVTPHWLDAIGTWISISFLVALGIINGCNVFTAAPGRVVAPAGLKARWFPGVIQVGHPALIAGVGALFALSFDTVSQLALLSFTASMMAGPVFCIALGVVFTLGMMTTDGVNGLWVSRLLRRADRRALIASRVMGLTIAGLSLLVGGFGILKECFPAAAVDTQARGLTFGFLVVAVVTCSFLLGIKLAPPARARARLSNCD